MARLRPSSPTVSLEKSVLRIDRGSGRLFPYQWDSFPRRAFPAFPSRGKVAFFAEGGRVAIGSDVHLGDWVVQLDSRTGVVDRADYLPNTHGLRKPRGGAR